jgi:5-formyltetrahydrofolate cyclo-ligase
MNHKPTLREEARARRAALARVHSDFASRLAEHAEALGIAEGSVVGGYMALKDEADPARLLERLAGRDCLIAFPRVTAKDAPLVFHTARADSDFVLGAFGVREPRAETPTVTPNVLLVPLLAFDAAGHRLGYGGGFYDRTLHALRAEGTLTAIGVGFAGQEIPAIGGQHHDQRLDMVVTELGVRRFL